MSSLAETILWSCSLLLEIRKSSSCLSKTTISTLILNCDIHHITQFLISSLSWWNCCLKSHLAQQSCAGAAFEILAALLELSLMVLIWMFSFPYSSRTQLYNTKRALWNETWMRWWICDDRRTRGGDDENRCPRYLSAWQDVRVGLYPRDDLTQDDPERKHIHLQGEEDGSIRDGWIHIEREREIKLKTGRDSYHFYCSGDFSTKLHSNIVHL